MWANSFLGTPKLQYLSLSMAYLREFFSSFSFCTDQASTCLASWTSLFDIVLDASVSYGRSNIVSFFPSLFPINLYSFPTLVCLPRFRDAAFSRFVFSLPRRTKNLSAFLSLAFPFFHAIPPDCPYSYSLKTFHYSSPGLHT